MAESSTSSKGRDMKMMSGWLAAILGGVSIILSAQTPAPHRECAGLTRLTLPDIKIGEAVAVPAETSGEIRAAHCRVTGVIGTEIRTAETAKAILRHYYGATEKHSYFSGCSKGGRQGLMEAQRFPDDFDGIVVGAPAHDFVGLAAQFVRDVQAVFPDPRNLSAPMFAPETLKSVEAQIVEKCDAVDGVKDGLLEDPRRCNVDVAELAGLSDGQRAALKKIYAETSGKAGAIYPARPVGGEGEVDSWPAWITGGSPYATRQAPSLGFALATHFFKFLVFNDPSWDYSGYDVANARKDARLAATFMNATNPDLDAFKAKGRKLIVWHGWSDAALTALGSIEYYEEVRKRDDGVRDYFRLFLMPGVLHCSGGPGPDTVDWPVTLADWVENGKAPDRVIARKAATGGAVSRTRPLCPYPQHAEYTGAGSTDDAANFVCR